MVLLLLVEMYLWVPQVPQALLVYRVPRVPRVQLEFKVILEQLDPLGLLAPLACWDPQAPLGQVPQVPRAQLVQSASQVLLEFQASRVPPDLLGHLESQAPPAQLAPQDSQAPLDFAEPLVQAPLVQAPRAQRVSLAQWVPPV